MNSHILLYLRWQAWCARISGRLFAETMLIEWHNRELELSD